MPYKSEVQKKNIAWYLPRPKKDRYRGGMPLYCEEWLIELAKDILSNQDAKVLNMFSGMNKIGFRVDIREEVKPDLICDVHYLTEYLKEKFDIILADPPYSNKEAKELYGTPTLNYKQWTKQAEHLLNNNGLLIVYHKYVMPNPNKELFNVVKRVFVGNRIYHVPRVAIYFQKKMPESCLEVCK